MLKNQNSKNFFKIIISNFFVVFGQFARKPPKVCVGLKRQLFINFPLRTFANSTPNINEINMRIK